MKKNIILIILIIIIAVIGGLTSYKLFIKTPAHSTVIYKYEHNPLAAIHIIYPGLRSQENIPGTTALTLGLLDHGTNQTRLEIAKQAEYIGAQYAFYATADNGVLSLVCPAKYLPEAISFLQELITQATLPEEEFSKLKKEQLVALAEEATNPFAAGMNINRQSQYPGHFYQTGIMGTTETVVKITQADCQKTLKHLQHPEKILIVVNGGYPIFTTRKNIQTILTELTPGQQLPPVAIPQKPSGMITAKLPIRTETGLLLANIIAPAIGKDYALYRCIEAYIGRGLSSPLFIRARDLNGIGYKVGALYDARVNDGLLTLFIQSNQKHKQALSEKLFDLSKLTSFDSVQAKRAREYVRTTDLRNDEATLSRGYKLAWNRLYGLPRNYSLTQAVKQISDTQLKQALAKLQIQNTVIID